MADPVVDLLKSAKLNDAQRAGLFDVYQASKNEDDLASRLQSLELPNDVKASLWDLKAAQAKPATYSRVADMAVGLLPTAGAVIGGGLGVEGGPLGVAAGAGAGGALGKAVQQKINVWRGKTEPPPTVAGAVAPVALEGAEDAAGALVLGGAGKLLKGGSAVAAPAVEAVGGAMQKVGASPIFKSLSRGGAILYGIATGDARTALEGGFLGPRLVEGAGKAVSAAGSKMARAVAAKGDVLARLERIPIADRLAKIGLEGVEHAPVASVNTLPADVGVMRDLLAKGYTMPAVVKIAADGSAEYGEALKTALLDSIKKQGFPPPEAVTRLLATKSFAQLPK